MKIIKRIAQGILILIVIVILFRGWIYRHLITYRSVGLRTNYSATDEKLVHYLNASVENETDHNVEEIIKLGLSITSEKLNFTSDRNDVDPNDLVISEEAHCVGYAAFCATTINYILEKNNLADTWIAKPQVGQLFFLGINVHQYFSSPFFRDHDFVTIENKITGQVFAVDPTVSDYILIDFITYEK